VDTAFESPRLAQSRKYSIRQGIFMPDDVPSSPRIGPLFALFPFVRPYAVRWALAFLALVTSAGATLALPVTFKYLIDRGFAAGDRSHIDRYFLALFVVSLVLAGATALRFYLVSWLGERVTADLRRAVYDHVLEMSPQFFETTQTGEVLSRLTTDTTLIQTVVGTSLSMGLRNFFLLTGGVTMLAVTSPVLSGYIIATLVVVVARGGSHGRARTRWQTRARWRARCSMPCRPCSRMCRSPLRRDALQARLNWPLKQRSTAFGHAPG
jgi:ATP-binding cassette, subfamily B, bacterial